MAFHFHHMFLKHITTSSLTISDTEEHVILNHIEKLLFRPVTIGCQQSNCRTNTHEYFYMTTLIDLALCLDISMNVQTLNFKMEVG